jgi:hypothetical protein
VTAVYILNHSPTKSDNGKTPYEVWHAVKLGVQHLQTFGCVAQMKLGSKMLTKLEDRSTPMVFIGYEPGSKACRFFDLVSTSVHVSFDAVFEEHRPWKRSIEDQGTAMGDEDPFTVEHITIRATLDSAPAALESPIRDTQSPVGGMRLPIRGTSTPVGGM